MRRCLYALLAVAGMLSMGQSAKADWYVKLNPVTGGLDYYWDPKEPWPDHPPGPGNWLIIRDYVNLCWIAYPMGGQ